MSDQLHVQGKKSVAIVAQIASQARRKIHAKRQGAATVWLGLGMMGLIGWSIVVPTLLGVVLGLWLDKYKAGQHSWTLALLMAGLTLGCFIAWHWVEKEQRAMGDEQPQFENKNENDTKK